LVGRSARRPKLDERLIKGWIHKSRPRNAIALLRASRKCRRRRRVPVVRWRASVAVHDVVLDDRHGSRDRVRHASAASSHRTRLQYLAQHFHDEIAAHMRAGDAPVELITLLHYAPQPMQTKLRRGSVHARRAARHARLRLCTLDQAPTAAQCVLATSLLRAKKKNEANLVFSSVMDSAKTTEDEGTFWQPEDRAWLWYNDTSKPTRLRCARC